MPGAEVVAVSAKTGAGLDELRAALARVAVDERDDGGGTRLYVDRSFSLPGIGTVATGTLWSGRVAAGDLLRLEPAGRVVRVRSVQVHDAAVDEAEAGQRVAVNLPDARAQRDRPRRRARRARPLPRHLSPRRQARRDAPSCLRRRPCTSGRTPSLRGSRATATYAQLRLVTAGRRRARRPRGAAHRDHRRRRRRARSRRPRGGSSGSGSSCSTAAHPRRSWPRSSTSRSPARELQARGILPPARARARARVARRPPASTCSRRRGSPPLRDRRARAARRARPHEPARSGPAARRAAPAASRGRRTSRTCSRSSGAARRRTSQARALRSASAQVPPPSSSSGSATRRSSRSTTSSSRASSRRRAACGASATATPSRPSSTTAGAWRWPSSTRSRSPAFRDALGVGRRTAQLLLERYDADGLTLRRGDVRTLRRSRA